MRHTIMGAMIVAVGSAATALAIPPQQKISKNPLTSGDVLPIEHGFYIESTTSCGSARIVDALLFEGKALGPTHGMTCKTQRVSRGPNRWLIKSYCEGGSSEQVVNNEHLVQINNRASFDVLDRQAGVEYRYKYRLCRKKELTGLLATAVVD